MPTFGFALFPYHYRFTCFPFSIIAFYRSNHHFSSAKIVCRRERHGCLDQWRSRFNRKYSINSPFHSKNVMLLLWPK
nr:MAG TPA: hypothetical protein [Caudoviricetes sp.]